MYMAYLNNSIIKEIIKLLCHRDIILNMSEEEIVISVTRMEKLLTGIMKKIEKLIEKHELQNLVLFQEIIDLVKIFKKFIISRMQRTPEVERMHIINLHDCRIKIAETLSEFEALQKISEEQNSKSEIFLREVVCLNDEEEIMRSIKETSEIEIPREIEESMQKMLIVREQEETGKKLLQSEIHSAEQKLHTIIESNAVTEKKLFDMCAKVEREHLDLLIIYDRDIGALFALTEKLSNENEVIKAEIKNMEDQLVVQRALYAKFKKEREIALAKAFTEKLDFFRRNQAAKIIQRAWRTYFQRISLKRRRKTRRK